MLAQNRTQREHALGSFTDLARAMVVDPAMLLWLDGTSNKAGKPNENLAREFMELFTLGVGHYTEDDVREAARALTGWSAKRDADGAQLVAKRHDDGVKKILGASGDFDAESFTDLVLGRPDWGLGGGRGLADDVRGSRAAAPRAAGHRARRSRRGDEGA